MLKITSFRDLQIAAQAVYACCAPKEICTVGIDHYASGDLVRGHMYRRDDRLVIEALNTPSRICWRLRSVDYESLFAVWVEIQGLPVEYIGEMSIVGPLGMARSIEAPHAS